MGTWIGNLGARAPWGLLLRMAAAFLLLFCRVPLVSSSAHEDDMATDAAPWSESQAATMVFGGGEADDDEESRGQKQTDKLWTNLEWRERWHQAITNSPPAIASGAGSSAASEADALAPVPQAPTVGTLGTAVAWCVHHEYFASLACTNL